jgi:hypothetical protein
MPLEVLSGAAALLLYPGMLTVAVTGLAAEAVSAWVLAPSRGIAAGARATLAATREVLPRPPALPSAAGLLVLLAATQVAAPLNPLPALDRNSLVAAAALMGASWIGWAWGWGRRRADARLGLLVQACWLLAVLLPSIAPENLRPQVLGGITVPALLPLKIACGTLYLACLPALLQIIPETAPQGTPGEPRRGRGSPEEAGFSLVRGLLWLPYCGLFASLFFPASGDDPLGVLRFALLMAGSAALAIAVAANLCRRPAGANQALYRRLALPFAAFTIAVALLTNLLG